MKKKINYEVVDNFLPEQNFLKIKEVLLGDNLPWYYYPNISAKNTISSGPLFYMMHLFYDREPNSNFYYPIKENLLNFMKIKSLIRVKANLYPNQSIKEINEMHVDYDYKHNGAIFSVNTNNGGTLLKDGTKIDSVENRMLFFDASEEHDSVNCTDEKVRVNINLNYF